MPSRQNNPKERKRSKFADRLRKLILFAMLGALMFSSKVIMELLPNVHLLGALTMIYTLVYRKEALIPIYVFVSLTGLFYGGVWWIPYCYIWTILWAWTMLLPKNMPTRVAIPVYMAVCALHGLLYGIMYAPFQALAFGLDWRGMLAWVASGFPWDVLHAAGNLLAGTLIFPLSTVLNKLENKFSARRSLSNNDKRNQ